MPFLDDLAQATNMFRQGAQQLGMQRAIANANEATQQIKASEADEMEKRSQLQQVANQMVMHLASAGTPDTTIESLKGSMSPAKFSDAGQMFGHGLMTGSQTEQDAAKQWQKFNFDLEEKKALAEAKRDPFKSLMAQQAQALKVTKEFDTYGKSLDAAAASSRTGLGQWASTENRGQRIGAILGTPDSWKAITPQNLDLVAEGLGQMSKGGVPTKEESAMLRAVGPQVLKAQAAALITGKPQAVDLSGYASLYSNIAQREEDKAKEKITDILLNRINASAKLHQLDPDQYKLTTAKSLRQVGINVSPDDISVDKKSGVTIKGFSDVMNAADQVPSAVKQAYSDIKKNKPEAVNFFRAYGITPDIPPARAIEMIRQKIKAKLFE